MTKIVGIGGSLRTSSYSMMALKLASERVKALDVDVQVLDLRTMTLPFCDGGKDYSNFPDVSVLREVVTQADGLILATPEYHGSVSGVIKNALDLMGFTELSGKVTGLISVLGGQPNSNALNEMRLIMRWVHAWVIPEQIAIGQAWRAFDEDGQLIDEKLAERFDEFTQSLVTNTQRLNTK
ncbi:NADPH-dependent FMN reductase [Acaryochloris sp. IP29b_bin.137]|uniref:NADPH-dependent FMN reductase n=1 Tax=Acaryochloris sp. IP29b_bin.137 TaxID=2969217 RepID=UPI002608D200|nr:NADPH-dependent FMN reductase [Acaryochloris sp. IP29b_bin.137]